MFDPSWFTLQTGFLATWTGIFCAIVLGSLILWILMGAWVYRDAESRGMGGVVWLILVIFLGLIGLIIYLIVRGSHPVRPPGGQWPPPGPGYAPPVPPAAAATAATCKECGAPLVAGAIFCAKCGAKV
jgi:hypothetical protein